MPRRTLRPRKKKTTPKLSTKPYKSISDILLATEAPKAKSIKKMKRRVLKRATKKAPAYKIPKTPKESGIGWGP